jgi:transposase
MKPSETGVLMTVESIDVNATSAHVKQLLAEEKDLSPALIGAIELLLLVVKIMADRLSLNSRNSSKSPSTDPNREKKFQGASKARGGQKGHQGQTLEAFEEPDEIKHIPLTPKDLPPGQYKDAGYERRQEVDIRISRHVTEYRAQALENGSGRRYVAAFPESLNRPVQYGNSIKANAVYMSMFQLIPYERIQTHFIDQFGIAISSGSLFNFNRQAYERLTEFAELARHELRVSDLLHADETGINVDGKRVWLHNASNDRWTYLAPHGKRGHEAMQTIGILPKFQGTLCHDHWKPYYQYLCEHSLCNAHHLRELTQAWELDHQSWAKRMQDLLLEINQAVTKAGGKLSESQADLWREKYRSLLETADEECPSPQVPKNQRKRGRVKRSKSRNLLERLRDYEDDTLRFIENERVPFTNNLGERDIRMTKVQQKISGCFRSWQGAEIFCRIRSYLATCRKNNVSIGEALECLFNGRWPEFIQDKLYLICDRAE